MKEQRSKGQHIPEGLSGSLRKSVSHIPVCDQSAPGPDNLGLTPGFLETTCLSHRNNLQLQTIYYRFTILSEQTSTKEARHVYHVPFSMLGSHIHPEREQRCSHQGAGSGCGLRKKKRRLRSRDDMRTLTTEAERNAYFLQLREKGKGGREEFGTPNAGVTAIH